MVERLGGPLVLPRFTGTPGEIAAFKGEIALAGNRRELYKRPFTVELPRPIGTVPPEEHTFFDNAVANLSRSGRPHGTVDISLKKDTESLRTLRANLPRTIETIEAHLEQLNIGLSLEGILIETKLTKKGAVPLTTEWHYDDSVFFLITNRLGTEFNHGTVSINANTTLSLQDNNPPISADPYDIVPINHLTVHRSPIFPIDAVRTRAVFFTQQD